MWFLVWLYLLNSTSVYGFLFDCGSINSLLCSVSCPVMVLELHLCEGFLA